MTLKKMSFVLISFSLVALGCATKEKQVSVSMNNRSYRDMRQHTFNESESIHFGVIGMSPDGGSFAYVSDEYKHSDIFIKGVNSKAVKQKTDNSGANEYPAFSPDGTKLAFASNRNGNWDIFILNVNGGKATRQITFGKENCIAPSWSHDGKKIAYNKLSASTHAWEIWIYNFENGSYSSLTNGVNPLYSPVNDTIVFQRGNTKGWYALWMVDDEGREETNILTSNDEGYFDPSWSYDGTKIVFASGGKTIAAGKAQGAAEFEGKTKEEAFNVKERRGSNIWVINRDGSDLTRLTEDDKAHFWCPRFSSDGRVYFISEQKIGKAASVTNIFSVLPEFINTAQPAEVAKPRPVIAEKPPEVVVIKPPVIIETPIKKEEEPKAPNKVVEEAKSPNKTEEDTTAPNKAAEDANPPTKAAEDTTAPNKGAEGTPTPQ